MPWPGRLGQDQQALVWRAGWGASGMTCLSRLLPPASSDEIRQDGLVTSKQASFCPSACTQHTQQVLRRTDCVYMYTIMGGPFALPGQACSAVLED